MSASGANNVLKKNYNIDLKILIIYSISRKRIVKEQGISNIEQYMFDTDEDLRRVATECVCNLVRDEDVIEYFLE